MAPEYSEPSLVPWSPLRICFYLFQSQGFSLHKMLCIAVWETFLSWSVNPGKTRRKREPEILPGCLQTGLKMGYELGASTWNLNVTVFPLLSLPTQKESGSELAALLSFVIILYTHGNFNV